MKPEIISYLVKVLSLDMKTVVDDPLRTIVTFDNKEPRQYRTKAYQIWACRAGRFDEVFRTPLTSTLFVSFGISCALFQIAMAFIR